MPKRVNQERIVYALKQAEAGVKTSEICRENGISEQTFYNWKRKYGGMGVSELRRLRLLEEENRKLKQLVAELTLDKHILQEVVKKKF
jgi:putative transposase